MQNSNIEFPWVIFKIENLQYAISCKNVESMVTLTEVTRVPNVPDTIRGIINLRGMIVNCIDFRTLLGVESMQIKIENFHDLMTKRLQDHVNWLNELELSVKEHREFALTTDPHKCAFGKWYDSFKTDSVVLSSLLKKFDEPHKAIHNVASTVKSLEDKRDYQCAQEGFRRKL